MLGIDIQSSLAERNIKICVSIHHFAQIMRTLMAV